MNCILFAKMDQVFGLKINFKNTGKMEKKYWNGKVRKFCQAGKVGTMCYI